MKEKNKGKQFSLGNQCEFVDKLANFLTENHVAGEETVVAVSLVSMGVRMAKVGLESGDFDKFIDYSVRHGVEVGERFLKEQGEQ